MNVIVAKPKSKDKLNFNGVFKGHEINEVLVCNRVFEKGKTYIVSFKDFEIEGKSIVLNADKVKELG